MTKNKILIIEDEEDLREILEEYITSAGYVVKCASDGLEGLKIYESFQPELVVTDINLPKMKGLEVLEKIKLKSPLTDVIMMTGYGDKEIVIQALKAGAVDYFDKPFNYDRLIVSIENCFKLQKAKRDLLKEKSFNESILNSMCDMVLAVDDQDKITYLNAAVVHLMEYKKEELIGQSLFKIISDAQEFNVVKNPNRATDSDIIFSNKNNEKIKSNLMISSLIKTEGVSGGKVLVARDRREIRKL